MLSEHIDAPLARQEVPVLLCPKRSDTSAIDVKHNHDSTERVKKNGCDQMCSLVDLVGNSHLEFVAKFEQQLELQ